MQGISICVSYVQWICIWELCDQMWCLKCMGIVWYVTLYIYGRCDYDTCSIRTLWVRLQYMNMYLMSIDSTEICLEMVMYLMYELHRMWHKRLSIVCPSYCCTVILADGLWTGQYHCITSDVRGNDRRTMNGSVSPKYDWLSALTDGLWTGQYYWYMIGYEPWPTDYERVSIMSPD